MQWEFYTYRFINTFCMSRGLTSTTIQTYTDVLKLFSSYMETQKQRTSPKEVNISDVFDYLQYLKTERRNGQNSIQKNAAIIKKFYEGLVALGLIDFYHNPVRDFKKFKGGEQRVRDVLSRKEVKKLLLTPNEKTILGIRDRAIILLLYSTGIRASECVGLKMKDVDLEGNQINVMGKGQKERVIPLNNEVVKYLRKYLKIRGEGAKLSNFFVTRNRKGITRKGIYDRIKKYVREAKIGKVISPHNLRHTFATEMIERKVNLVTIQHLLGHRAISSTMRYLRINLKDIREAIDKHPINEFTDILERLLPDVRLPYQLSRSGFK